jgi:hypothetical protein
MNGMNDIVQHLNDLKYLALHDRLAEVDPKVVAAICSLAVKAIQPTVPVRPNAPTTTRKAAQSVAPRAGSQRHRLLEQYWLNGELTDEEAGEASGLRTPGCAYWMRCSELRQQGFIEPTGRTRLSMAGEQQNVCRITDEGRRVFEYSTVA